MILLTIFMIVLSAADEINKCCPDGQTFNMVGDQIICVPADNASSKYDWLPKGINETIINNLKVNINKTQCSDRDVEWSLIFSLNVSENSVLLEDEIIFRDSSFCLEKLNYAEKIFIVARECPCLEQICIPKCCKSGKHLNDTNHCIDSGNTTDWMFDKLNETITGNYRTIYGYPDCEALNKTSKYAKKYELNSDGSINTNMVTVFEPTEYCGDYKQIGDGPREEIIIACFNEVIITTESKIYGILSLIGAFFFLLTSIVLCWIPEVGGSPKWFLTNHVICCFVAYVSLAYQQLSPSMFGATFCTIIAFVLQFSFVASFFWLNVICINLSQTFHKSKTLNNKKFTEKRSFIIYSLYAWSGSSLITLVTFVSEFSSILDRNSPLKPNFGEVKCWFISKDATWAYFFGPIGILLIFNLGLFIYITYKFIVFKHEFKTEDGKKKNNSKIKRRFLFTLKLLFWMGIPWMAEIVSWTVDGEYSVWHYFWYITDFMNLLRAVIIFNMICCTERTWKMMNKKAPWIGRYKEFIKSLFCENVTVAENANKTVSITSSGLYASEINGISLKQFDNNSKPM